MKSNVVSILGYAKTEFVFNHEFCEEKFYRITISSQRDSGAVDLIPVIVSEKLINLSDSIIDKEIKVVGEFRSYNQKDNDKIHVVLFVFASEFEIVSAEENKNEIQLDGYICNVPTCRKTPSGRKISDITLAVNRLYGKSDYIPCILWGRNASFSSNLKTGQHISVIGRIQSRDYLKKYDEEKEESKTAYEVSVNQIYCVD